MPDVTRSDSQRSDASLRPRVSFNRDVHVKRIVPNEASRIPAVLSGETFQQPSPVRKARLSKSKQRLAEEAARVLDQVEKVDCVAQDNVISPEKFYTLPARRKHKINLDSPQSSVDRKIRRRKSEELGVTAAEHPPKKPPRTFAHYPKSDKPQRTSIFNLFRRSDADRPKKSNLRRSVSDATHSKSYRSPSDDATRSDDVAHESDEHSSNLRSSKKQLTPIIEVTQRDDYFSPTENKENVEANGGRAKSESVTEKLKEFIDEVDSALFNETGFRIKQTDEERTPEIVVIDVDKAEKISRKKDKSKITTGAIGKKLRSLGKGKKPKPKTQESKDEVKVELIRIPDTQLSNSIIQETIENLHQQTERPPKMIHSSQKPVEKLPLTRGLTVDSMVKRLNSDKSSTSPPKTNVMVHPNVSVQHNNNQPFSYTRGPSPERAYRSPEGSRSPISPGSPVIYAHVVCDKNGVNNSKQTVHTAYTNGKKHLPHSDSDEGLGNEENSGFGRKYEAEKHVTHFGDERYYNERNLDEYPIKPKFKSVAYNGFGNGYEYTKTEHGVFFDSSSRGRGDGMDSKRRESLTEPHENGFASKYNGNSGRTDLSTRRDLLESRINRRLNGGDKGYLQSLPTEPGKLYRNGSASPVGYTEAYVSEARVKTNRYNGYDNEPKSFDSQVSDYRSSPENVARRLDASHEYRYTHSSKYKSKEDKQKLMNDKEHYKSNPEILQRSYDSYKYDDTETYHDSLKRENDSSRYRPQRYFDQSDCERKDKLGDSGIENDFRTPRSSAQRREYNESDDEGFASSLLIASERQHTEENVNSRKTRKDYDSDRGYRERDERDYKFREYKSKEYVPRERSIDDGSHYDPRIDKDLESDRSTLKKRVEKKPPKPEKKSSLEKVKQLFTRDSSKKNKEKKERAMVPEENLRARYTEYKGSRENLEPRAIKKNVTDVKTSYTNSNRRRSSTPSPSPTRKAQRKPQSTPNSWFKSLDRLARKKSKNDEKEMTSEEESLPKPKSLRFFGDTDLESNDSIRHKPSTKMRSSLSTNNYSNRTRSQSSRELHNISEERRSPEFITPIKNNNHKSLLNISESERDAKGSRLNFKPPMSPNHRSNRDVSRNKDDRGRRRRNEVSSVESSTEGDSSQQSQRSVVYLHAATVGDIPGPGYLKSVRRAASREELTSNSSSTIKPQTKTLSRSFSVLAPWRPRHHKETYDIDYTQYPKQVKNGKYEQKVSKTSNSRKDNSSTLKKKANETRRSNQNVSTLNRRSRSKENVSSQQTLRKSKEDMTKGSSSTLYKKKERQPKENMRYTREREDKRTPSKSLSIESLGNGRRRDDNRDVTRSISMPRDPEKSAGWFKMSKKSKKSSSTQRL